MAEDPPVDDGDPQVDQLRRENEVLRERLDSFRGLEEELASQRVFEKARKRLISWVSLGGLAVAVAGAFGLKEIYDLASSSAIGEATRQAEEAVKQVASDDVVLDLLEAKIDERLTPLNEEIEAARAAIDDELATLDQSVAAIRKVITGAAEPPKGGSAAAVDVGGDAALSDDDAGEAATGARAADGAGAPRSIASKESTLLTFDNRSAVSVTVYWVGYDGREVPYGTVAPGGRLEQPTYVTHPWVLRTADDQRRIGTVVAGPDPETFTIGQSMVEGAKAGR